MIIKRTYSIPEQLTLLGAGATALAATLPLLAEHTGFHGPPCPLRTLTGIPCPFCGLTTATVALVHGHAKEAAQANPLVYVAAAAALATTPVLTARALGRIEPAKPLSARNRRRLAAGAIAISAAAWLYQLRRADLI